MLLTKVLVRYWYVYRDVDYRLFWLQVGKKFAKTPTEDKDYLRGKNMLQKLELQKYEKNFRKGMLTDETLPLVNDRFVPALTFSFY